MDPQESKYILENLSAPDRARIFQGNTQRPFGVQSMTITLTTARLETDPLNFNFPFKSVFVRDTTDSNVSISMKVLTNDSYQSAFSLRSNDSLNFDYPMSSCSLFWSAQSGKTITLIFFTDAQFRSGSQIATTNGGVVISEGSAVAGPTRVTLTAATAAIILPADTTRKISTIENFTGNIVYLGADSTVTDSGATRGISLLPGAQLNWRNTAALYGYSVLGGYLGRLDQT